MDDITTWRLKSPTQFVICDNTEFPPPPYSSSPSSPALPPPLFLCSSPASLLPLPTLLPPSPYPYRLTQREARSRPTIGHFLARRTIGLFLHSPTLAASGGYSFRINLAVYLRIAYWTHSGREERRLSSSSITK